MPRPLLSLLLFLSFLLAPPLASQSLSERELARSIDRIVDVEDLENAIWGIHIIDLASNRSLFEHNVRKSFVPASNVKLYTTAAAIEQLGPDFRYTTTVFGDGPVESGTLEGNLIIRGSGDPAFGGRFHDGDRLFAFNAWADSLKAMGITRIRGDIIGDDDVFDDVPLGAGWSWGDLPYWYSAEIGGLSFNDNNIDFEIRSRSQGEPAAISWEPLQTSYASVINRTSTTHPDSSLREGYERMLGTNVISISSQVPEGRTDFESLTITNPTLFFTHVFREALIKHGIVVEGRPVDIDELSIKPSYESEKIHRLFSYTSVPLTELVEVINKRSQNLYAEQVLRSIGVHRPERDAEFEPGSARMGVAAAIPSWVRAGVDTSRIRIADGSGLSRYNLITPEMTTSLLSYMWGHPDPAMRSSFVSSLPVGGVDGTLQSRFRRGRAHGNVQAKTGSLSGASSLSGYLRMRNGRHIAFSIMVNHYTTSTSRVREAQDEIIELLAAW